MSISSYDEPSEDGNEQSDYDDKLAMQIDFSDEEDEEEMGGFAKNKRGFFQEYKPQQQGVVLPFINQLNYFHKVGTIASPDIEKQKRLKNQKKEFMERFI